MAKGKENNDPTPQQGNPRPRRERPRADEQQDRNRPDNADSAENPEWWRGDPGRRGEVL
jgi:hypothetical protein